MSVDFDPVRVRPNRRRIDPVVVGVMVVVIALAVAIVKPWQSHDVAIVTAPSAAPAVSAATPARGRVPDGRVEGPARAPGPPPPTWSDLAPALSDHPAWGVAAVVLGSPLDSVAPARSGYLELWFPSVVGDAGVENAYVARAQESIVALGITAPPGEVPEDVRIWRVHDDGGLEWVDADPIVGRGAGSTMLLTQPGNGGGGAFALWAGGHYRIDVLVTGGIHRISVQIPGRFENVPAPDPWPAAPANLSAAKDGDPTVTRQGPFAMEDGVSVALSAMPGTLLDEDAEWRAALAATNSHGQSVAAVHLPRATGLGVMFTENAVIQSASIKRLAPDSQIDAAPAIGGISSIHGRTPYLVFTPVGEGAWSAGVYALSAAWTDAAGVHAATWPVELRPGVPGLGSTTALGPASGG